MLLCGSGGSAEWLRMGAAPRRRPWPAAV